MTDRVFVTRPIPEAGLAELRKVAEVVVRDAPMPPTRDELIAGLRGATGLISLVTDPVDAGVLESAGDLRAVSNFAVGFNNIDVAAATRLGIAVGNTPDVLTDATADCTLMLLLAAARCLRPGLEDVAAGRWRTWEPMGYLGQELAGKTLGIVGLGRIGSAVARRCRGGWGMNILYHNPRPLPDDERELGARFVDLPTLLAESDFVSLHCPATATNRGMIGREQLRRMKPTAVLINAARGSLVDEAALVEACRAGWIFAAGIDVTDPEPPAPESPLLREPNIVVAPHVGSATVVARTAMAARASANVMAALIGQAMPYPVNPGVVLRGGN
ncbi:MAG: D-glycerate dehydrogenase [Gemmataceae bacterium]|nr:D-glycerate dehydrogenase [Gemmataceae bacterium]